MLADRLRLAAPTVYLVLTFAASLFFATIFTVTAVYRVQAAGLDPFQLVLVGTVLEVAYFLFEIPTGVVADVYSRRLSVIIGYALIGVGFLVEGALPLFATILLAQVIWGIGATFTSGAEEAWMADEVGEGAVGNLYLRGAQAGQFGALLGAPLSVAIASTGRLNLPILIGGALFLAAGAGAGAADARARLPADAARRPLLLGRHGRHLPGRRAGGAGRAAPADDPAGGGLLRHVQRGLRPAVGGPPAGQLHAAPPGRLDPVAWFGVISVVSNAHQHRRDRAGAAAGGHDQPPGGGLDADRPQRRADRLGGRLRPGRRLRAGAGDAVGRRRAAGA